MVALRTITDYLADLAPPHYQEAYDNVGLLTGDPAQQVTQVMVALDITPEVVEEACQTQCQLIVAHHPLLFKPLKKLASHDPVAQVLTKAVREGVALYALHTNFDHQAQGINQALAQRLGLLDLRLLRPALNTQALLTLHACPAERPILVQKLDAATGKAGSWLSSPEEPRLLFRYPHHLTQVVRDSLQQIEGLSPEAYYWQAIQQESTAVGAGIIGRLPKPCSGAYFLGHLKERLSLTVIRYAQAQGLISRVALASGAGISLLKEALAQGADAFLTADIKYHDFFMPQPSCLLADIGHFESEVVFKELLQSRLTEHFKTLEVTMSKHEHNPVTYFC